MDDQHFDSLTKSFARSTSRRQLLKGLVGSLFAGGAIAATGHTGAAFICREGGVLCAIDAQCCTGRCVSEHCACPDGQILCRDRCISACTALDQCHGAGVCDPNTGHCTNPPVKDGTICTGTNPCFQSFSCQQGSCTGSDPVVCAALDACHVVGTCDPASGHCSTPPAAQGIPCGTGPTCTNGTAKAPDTCDGNGSCVTGATTHCGSYLCGATACLTNCTDDTQCVATGYCDKSSGTCKQDLNLGTPCTRDHQCGSGFCVDGYCCDSACTDQCAACNVPPEQGICSSAPAGAPVGGRPLCTGETAPGANGGASGGSICGGSCDGMHMTCTYPASGTTCGSATCTNDTFTSAPTCDGAGTCTAGTSKGCSPYLCGSDNTCQTSCNTFTDCASGFQCNELQQCVSCTPVGGNCEGSACCSGLTCDTNSLTCVANGGQPCTDNGLACQGKHCGTATNNCGQQVSCGTCTADTCNTVTCTNGTCVQSPVADNTSCGNGAACCSGQCIDTQTDVGNCGSCGTKCGVGLPCQNGACGTCVPNGYPCEAGISVCCLGGGTFHCIPNAEAGISVCCIAAGLLNTCSLNSDCCAPASCQDGACCLPTSSACADGGQCCSGSCTGGTCA